MKSVRIGNGCGFWGDNIDAPLHLVQKGQLDYLTLEYLAELTMSILALQKQKDPELGYAHDFLTVMDRLAPHLHEQPNLRIVTNAGGMNPLACARKISEILSRHELRNQKIAIVTGDDLMPSLDRYLETGHTLNHIDHGEPMTSIRDRLVSANAYLGGRSIVEALKLGATIVITGRVADASLTLGPLVHEFGWSWNDTDSDRLSAGTTAGHLIECGAQVTGGLWTNASDETNLAEIGYPIAEVFEDGRFIITKPEGSGGTVNRETVSEQLLYEVGDPAHYLTPDVVADFTSPRLKEFGNNRVEVTDCRGLQAPESYKVSCAYRSGFTAAGTLTIFGPDAVIRARKSADIILKKLRHSGCTFEHTHAEVLGAGDCVVGVTGRANPPEVVLRLAVRDSKKTAVDRFTREFAPLVTTGYMGTTGYTTGRPAVREVFAYWPSLIAKSVVMPRVEIVE